MSRFLRESFVPLLAFLLLLLVALFVLSDFAASRSRLARVISIGADQVALQAPTGSGDATQTIEDSGSWDDDVALLAIEEGADLDRAGWVGRSLQMASRDSLAEALGLLSALLASNPHRGSAWFARGSVLSRLNQTLPAIEAYENAVRYSGGRTKAVPLYNLGCLYRDSGRVDEAMAAFRDAIDRRPDYVEARLNLAALLAEDATGRNEARRLYDQVLRLRPDYALGYYDRGLVFLAQDEPDSAIVDFRNSVGLDPSLDKAWYNLGRLASRQGSDEEAVDAYRGAISANPDNLKARRNLATVLYRLGRYEGAVREGQALVEMAPDYASAWFNLALALTQLERNREARSAYDHLLRLEPDDSRAWLNLGVLYAREGNSDRACECYRETLDRDPTNEAARYNLALELRRKGKLKLALDTAVRLGRLRPEDLKTRQFIRNTSRRILAKEKGNATALEAMAEFPREVRNDP